MTTPLAVALVAFLVASAVQSATGFGFALIAGPVLFALVEPASAVALILILGQIVNLLILVGEGRRPAIEWPAVRPALIAAVPGLPVGALLVRLLSAQAMRLGVGITVCGLVIVSLARRDRPASKRAAGRTAASLAGFGAGVLTTSTTTNGPLLAIWLTARRMKPTAIRDSVTFIFFTLDLIGIGILVAVVGYDAAMSEAAWIPVIAPAIVVGHVAGRRIFERLPADRYTLVVLGLAFTSGVVSIVAALA